MFIGLCSFIDISSVKIKQKMVKISRPKCTNPKYKSKLHICDFFIVCFIDFLPWLCSTMRIEKVQLLMLRYDTYWPWNLGNVLLDFNKWDVNDRAKFNEHAMYFRFYTTARLSITVFFFFFLFTDICKLHSDTRSGIRLLLQIGSTFWIQLDDSNLQQFWFYGIRI